MGCTIKIGKLGSLEGAVQRLQLLQAGINNGVYPQIDFLLVVPAQNARKGECCKELFVSAAAALVQYLPGLTWRPLTLTL